ncbi:MAG: SDR family NAD(P)-dependent oxidoreductase [Candidatus Magasanikbacteria bacterium]|nr:SDR family NAD(P)-dependent oxidoreductase [Candidatus Magasanikbacteria bacterium]
MKTILITGGAGFIGSHTADELAAQGWKIRILDNLQKEVHAGKWPKYLAKKGYDLVRGDVRKKQDWLKALKGVSAVLHLAAYQDQRLDFSTFFQTNSVSTSFLYECIVEKKLPIKKVVLASSQFVYGDGQYICNREKKFFYAPLRSQEQLDNSHWNIVCACGSAATPVSFAEDQIILPTNSYGLSKKSLEEISLLLGKTYNIPTTCLRYSIVQGERQSPKNIYSGALRIFVSQAIAGVPITVYEDGGSTRDFVNVHDVVRANVLALTNHETDFSIFNVGGGKKHAIIDFAADVKRIAGSMSEIMVGGYRRTDTRHAVSDISKLKKFGWAPQYTTQDAIAEYVAWYKKEGFDKRADIQSLKKLKIGIK